ncbi:MAG: C45 family autoproteolytic acyltransferase/hydrolase [Planctomycetota bacterium]|jgi:hypothetical protein
MRAGRPGLACVAGLLLFGLAVGSLFVQATYGDAPTPPPLHLGKLPAADRARVQVVDGIPVVRLSGTPYEMGRQHGTIFRQQIRFLETEYVEAMVAPAVGGKAKLLDWARSVEKFIPEAYRQELNGMADGAGMTYERVLVANTMVDRFQTLMCSTVVAAGDATKDREIYFGRNLDFPGRRVLHQMTVVIVYEPEGRTPVVSVTWPGLVGVLSGMNGHGVCGATMLIHRGKPLRPGIPYMIMYREALARARKAGDVYTYIDGAERTCPNNFMVVDATGAAEVVEFDQDVVARRPADRGTVCSTNHFRSKELTGKEGWRVGEDRYASLVEFLEREHGKIDVDRIRKALGDVATPWLLNVQSMIFLPARRALYLSKGGALPAATQPFVHLPREVLLGRAEPAAAK